MRCQFFLNRYPLTVLGGKVCEHTDVVHSLPYWFCYPICRKYTNSNSPHGGRHFNSEYWLGNYVTLSAVVVAVAISARIWMAVTRGNTELVIPWASYSYKRNLTLAGRNIKNANTDPSGEMRFIKPTLAAVSPADSQPQCKYLHFAFFGR